jgi:hypothetical protein
VKNLFAKTPIFGQFTTPLHRADYSDDDGSSDLPRFTVGQRLVFRPGDDRAAEMLRSPPARDLVAGAFTLALADLDDDGKPELIVQRVTLPGISAARSTMVLKKRHDRYVKLLDCKLGETLALTNEKVGRFRAIAELDDSGSIRYESDDEDTGSGRQVVRAIRKPVKHVQ